MFDILVRSNLPQYFICARLSRATGRLKVFVQVEAHNKDQAIDRLREEYPYIERSDWEILDIIEKFDHNGNEHDIGTFGTKLPLPKTH